MFTPFYHALLRRYHVAFGSLFAETILLRNSGLMQEGDEVQRFTIPIEYSARDSWLARLRKDPNLTQRNNIILPRYAFEMTGLRYDSSRKLNTLNQRVVPVRQDGTLSLRRYFTPTPYILSFSLYAITRSIDDAQQIVEQITPYFAPDYTQLVRLIPSVNILDRMRIVMDGTPQWADSYEQVNFDATREVIVTFNFNAHANFYGPVASTPGSVIRHVMVDLYDVAGSESVTFPDRLGANGFGSLQDETGSFLLDETSASAVGRQDLRARIDIVPDPIDAPAERPVNVTSTITEYVGGVVETTKTSLDTVE